MILSIQPTHYLFVAIFLLFSFPSTGQDTTCTLSPPQAVDISTGNGSYSLSWTATNGANAYKVVVIDAESGEVLFSEFTIAPMVDLIDVSFSPDTYIGIACVCSNGEMGGYGYFPYESTTTINVQDIVMQMEGEENPRTLECDVEKMQVKSSTFSLGINTSFAIAPPFNANPSHPVEGAIVEVSLYDQTAGNVFAKATMLALSNNTVVKADNQTNITSTGNVYEFVTPAFQHFFYFTNPVSGEFEYSVNTTVPGGGTYQLLVEQRNCFNVNKIRKNAGNAPLTQAENAKSRMAQLNKQDSGLTDLYVYPNPAANYLSVSRNAENVTVRNQYGQVVYQVSSLSTQQAIPIQEWKGGIYYLETTTAAGEHQIVRFVKS